jgi:hypothetical protein
METMGILPKKANAILVSSVLIAITMLVFGGLFLFMSISSLQSFN